MTLMVVAPSSSDQASAAAPTVAILMGTKDGARFLPEQLHSLVAQTHRNWTLHISDDGSTDETLAICRAFQAEQRDRVSVREGPRQGHCRNFLSLVLDASIEAAYFAYCDQDDIWAADKLERAIARLSPGPDETPALYCGRTGLMTEDGRDSGYSPLFRHPPEFRNALVQSIAGGNTMVFNAAARNALLKAGDLRVVSHDWWTYQLISGVGGRVFYDPRPAVRYRQHGGNAVGSNRDWHARLTRVKMLMSNRFRDWNDINVAALQKTERLLTNENQMILAEFAKARNGPLWSRLAHLHHSRVHRQTMFGNLSLFAAAVLHKL